MPKRMMMFAIVTIDVIALLISLFYMVSISELARSSLSPLLIGLVTNKRMLLAINLSPTLSTALELSIDVREN